MKGWTVRQELLTQTPTHWVRVTVRDSRGKVMYENDFLTGPASDDQGYTLEVVFAAITTMIEASS